MNQFSLPLALYGLGFLLAFLALRLQKASAPLALCSALACLGGLLTGLVAGLSLAQLLPAQLPVLALCLWQKGENAP